MWRHLVMTMTCSGDTIPPFGSPSHCLPLVHAADPPRGCLSLRHPANNPCARAAPPRPRCGVETCTKALPQARLAYRVAAVVCCSVLVTAALFTSLAVGVEPGSSQALRVPPETAAEVAADYVVHPPPGAVPPPLLQPPTVLGAYRAGDTQDEDVSNSGVAAV